MKKSQAQSQSELGAASPFVACSSSHTTFRSVKPTPVADAGGSHWPTIHTAPGRSNLLSSTTMVLVQEDGQCDLSLDGSYVNTPVMGGDDGGGGGNGSGGMPRYVAGNAFFNYQLYGGLRKGGSVSLFSRTFRGYALAAFSSGYTYVAVMYLLLRLPDSALSLDKSTRLRNVLSLQWTVVLLVGILSDAFAPMGWRRKSYVIAGWLASGVFWMALFLMFALATNPPQDAIMALIVLAFLSLVVATNAMDIRIIELSQQEELQYRGRLLGSYEALRIGAQVVAHSLIAAVVTPDVKTLDVHLPFRVDYLFLHLALICWIPIYWLLHNAHEDKVPHAPSSVPASVLPTVGSCSSSSSSRTNLRAILRTFWQSAQQRVVWQLILFNGILFFFGFFELADVRRAVQFWTFESSIVRLVRNCVGDVAFVVVLLLWRGYGINVHWRVLTGATILLLCTVNFTTATLVIYDVVRAPWIVTISWILRAPFRVLLLFAAFVPTIEIAPLGAEGTTYALLATFQSIVKFLAAEIASGIVSQWPAVQFNYKTIRQSASHTQNTQFYGLVATTIVMLCALSGLACLPQQKLDAQQLRAYGGYSRWPLVLLILGFVVATPYVFYLQISRVQN